MKKHAGSFTPAVAWMMVLVLFVNAVLWDYSRIKMGHVVASQISSNAVEAALFDYQSEIAKSFDLLCVTDSTQIKAAVEEVLSEGINQGYNELYSLRVESVDVSFLGETYADPQAIKYAILKRHSERFMLGKLTQWLEKLEFFKSLGIVTSMLEELGKVFDKVTSLQDAFDLLGPHYERVSKWLNQMDDMNVLDLVNRYHDLNSEASDLKRELGRLSESIKEATDESELSRLRKERASIKDALDEVKTDIQTIRERIQDFRDGVEGIDALIESARTFTEELQQTLDLLAVVGVKIEDNRERYKSMNYVAKVCDAVAKTLSKITQSVTKANSAAAKVLTGYDTGRDRVMEMIRIIDDSLARGEKIAKEICEADSLGGYFKRLAVTTFVPEGAIDQDGNFDGKALIRALRDVVLGDVFKLDEAYLGQLPEDVYKSLPSQRAGIEQEGVDKSRSSGSTRNQADEINKSFNRSSNQWSALLDAQMLGAKSLIDKLIIADYLVNHFTYNVPSRFTVEEQTNPFMPQSEIEYVLHGNRSNASNAILTDTEIFGVRLLMNASSLLITKQTTVQSLSAQLAAATGGISYPIMYAVVVAGWSGTETVVDVKKLHLGESIPLFKKGGEWMVDLSPGNLAKLTDFIRLLGKSDTFEFSSDLKEGADTKLDWPSIELSYEDYLVLLLMFQNETEQLYRVADLLQLSTVLSDEGLTAGDLETAVAVTVTVSVDLWFSSALGQYVNDDIHDGRYYYTFYMERGY
ncbi:MULTISPECIES: DUF5702 domain-containing protein [unclassified Fusibacter]|uniref:DUF5702 domain-containing protein n=1 Tax=unclassified Fusibacter TaxID=2624464 RepID=UPI0010117EB7|nr:MULTISPECIES: DUF5702 domain-containing protein [unclassified Fusibacter]MCK8060824.1 DUF5702 domain-containing protein [Fusibacter sp. A2]NPE23120.1 hypothetical protein [Fusibacter sp. A1]RXV59792.1 hypothetical protein DWB64_14910 [Fusibacter sp. A1]